jgi:hypothetical protein
MLGNAAYDAVKAAVRGSSDRHDWAISTNIAHSTGV